MGRTPETPVKKAFMETAGFTSVYICNRCKKIIQYAVMIKGKAYCEECVPMVKQQESEAE